MKVRVGIIGCTGYTGLGLIKLILNHRYFEPTYLAASSEGNICDVFPNLSGVCEFKIEQASSKQALKMCDLVFLAMPHTQAMKFAKELRDIKVVDLSADYRLSLQGYEKNYGAHLDKDGLKDAVYGLLPFNKSEVANAKLIANPGCYPTASLLAIAPFAKFIEPEIIIDAKSGVSGAGKGLKKSSHFCEVNENLNAYSAINHRHACEISEQASKFMGFDANITFVPHLLPITTGMLVSVYMRLKTDIDPFDVLSKFYKDETFIRIKNEPVHIKNVVNSHFCDIFAMKNGKTLFVSSAIDNLLRGASSSALANANLMCGFCENEGLPKFA